MSNKDAIIEKIAKLMKMVSKNGASAGEEEVAFAKVQKLMQEYDLTEKDISEKDTNGMKEHHIIIPSWVGKEYASYAGAMLAMIAKSTNCMMLVAPGLRKGSFSKAVMIGREADLILNAHFAESAFNLHKKESKKHKEEFAKTVSSFVESVEKDVKEAQGWSDSDVESWRTTASYKKYVLNQARNMKVKSTRGFNTGFLVRMTGRFKSVLDSRMEAARKGGYSLVCLDSEQDAYRKKTYETEPVTLGGNDNRKRKINMASYKAGEMAADTMSTSRPVA